jgi:hypothetical protein
MFAPFWNSASVIGGALGLMLWCITAWPTGDESPAW